MRLISIPCFRCAFGITDIFYNFSIALEENKIVALETVNQSPSVFMNCRKKCFFCVE